MCEFCDLYSDVYDVPDLYFSVTPSDISDSGASFDCFIDANATTPVLCVVATYSDIPNDCDYVRIPIRYCPMCGASV